MEGTRERRAHPRFVVSFSARCRRLGPRRMHADDMVRVHDISFGGMRIDAPDWIDVGNVVEIEKDGIALRGLVVGVSGRTPVAEDVTVEDISVIAEDGTRLESPADDDRGDQPRGGQAHIAFSNVSPECHWALAHLMQAEAGTG